MKIIDFFKRIMIDFLIIFWVILFIISLSQINYYFDFFNPNINENYEYTYSECERIDHSWDKNLVNNIYWESWNLIVKSKIDLNCSIEKQRWLVDIKNNVITLDINASSRSGFAFCQCNYDTEFKIKNISKDDYNIVLNKEWYEIDNFIFQGNWVVLDKCEDNISYSCYFPENTEKNSLNSNNGNNNEELIIHNNEIEINKEN